MISSSLLLRTVEETPDNEAMIRGLSDLKCGAVKVNELQSLISKVVV